MNTGAFQKVYLKSFLVESLPKTPALVKYYKNLVKKAL